jgi:hypothetical protein
MAVNVHSRDYISFERGAKSPLRQFSRLFDIHSMATGQSKLFCFQTRERKMAGICKFSAFLESGIPQAYSDVDRFLWLRTLEIFFLVIVAFILLLYNKSIAILPLVIKKGGRVDGQKGIRLAG